MEHSGNCGLCLLWTPTSKRGILSLLLGGNCFECPSAQLTNSVVWSCFFTFFCLPSPTSRRGSGEDSARHQRQIVSQGGPVAAAGLAHSTGRRRKPTFLKKKLSVRPVLIEFTGNDTSQTVSNSKKNVQLLRTESSEIFFKNIRFVRMQFFPFTGGVKLIKKILNGRSLLSFLAEFKCY